MPEDRGLLLQLESQIEARVKHELDRQLSAAIAAEVEKRLSERASWWRQIIRQASKNWGILILVIGVGTIMTVLSPLRVALHRNLLSFDETLSAALQGTVVYSTGGTFALRSGARGDERVWTLPFVAYPSQDLNIVFRVTYPDPRDRLPLRVKLLHPDTGRPIEIGIVGDSSSEFRHVLRDKLSERPLDAVYTLVVEAYDSPRYKGDYVTGVAVVQVLGAPVQIPIARQEKGT